MLYAKLLYAMHYEVILCRLINYLRPSGHFIYHQI